MNRQNLSKRLIPLITIMFFLSACAPTTPNAPKQQDSTAKTFKTSSKYGNVYLFRDTFKGGAFDVTTLVDGKLAGRIKQYSYFYWKLKPGKHTIQTKAVNLDTVVLNVKANENYFIELLPLLGMKLDARIRLVDEKKGKKGVLDSKLLKSEHNTVSYTPPTTNIKPVYVSPSTYKSYSCSQINKKIQKINDQTVIINADLGDSESRAISSALFFTPGLLLESNSNQRAVMSQLLGQYNALKIVAKEKKCTFSSKLK